MSSLIIIDAKNALFRFGFAHKLLQSNDKPTGSLYGVLGLLPRLKTKYRDARFVMVWEGEGQSWRHKFWDGYKSNRWAEPITKAEKENHEIKLRTIQQIAPLKEICQLIGIPQISVAGLEADDVIGLLAVRYNRAGEQVIIYSSDKDFMQLMPRGITIIRDVDKEHKLVPETKKSVFIKFGCNIGDLLMVRAIAGDKSDGIPNPVRGIGPKKATKYLECGEWPDSIVANWTTVQRNHRLMKIIVSLNSKELTDDQRNAIRDCYSLVDGIHPGTKSEYRQFVQLLADSSLTEALEQRAVLWGLQTGKNAV